MKYSELIETLSLKMNLPNEEVEKMMSAFVDIFLEKINDGEIVKFDDFCSFWVEKIEERIVFDENSQTKTLEPPKLVVMHKVDSAFNEKINLR